MLNKTQNILNVFEKLADIVFQNEVWLKDKYWHSVTDLNEAIGILYEYCFFDDLAQNKIGLLKDELNKVNTFMSKLMEYNDDDVEKMLSDQNWIEITMEAKIIFEILKKYKW